MKEIKISIPEYDHAIDLIWEENFKIKTSTQYNAITVEANSEGLMSLARHLLLLAQADVPSGSHFHLADYNALEDGSVEFIVSKNENL